MTKLLTMFYEDVIFFSFSENTFSVYKIVSICSRQTLKGAKLQAGGTWNIETYFEIVNSTSPRSYVWVFLFNR